MAASAAGPPHYRHPIVFCRGHGEVKSKIWIMEEDGSGQRQLTSGMTYDDHPSLYSDLRHVLYSEFPGNDFETGNGARLIKLDIHTGAREVVAEVPGCALHHASLSPFHDLLAYHRDCGKKLSEWVGWGPGSYEVNTIATNGVALPDGIIFMHEKNRGIPGARGVSIARMFGHGVGAKIIILTDDQHLNRRPAVSPDGKTFPGNDGHPWFSRDGATLVFESDRTGTLEIWKMNLLTLNCTQLTFGGKEYESDRPRM
jgi:hypothetical protein